MINTVSNYLGNVRTAILKRPNAMECLIYRQFLLRQTEGTLDELPILGNFDAQKNQDEAGFEYREIGQAKSLMKGQYEGEDVVDSADAIVPAPMLEALIECVDVPGYEIKKNHLVAVMPGGGVVIGFEIVDKTGNVAIYPYTTTWVVGVPS